MIWFVQYAIGAVFIKSGYKNSCLYYFMRFSQHLFFLSAGYQIFSPAESRKKDWLVIAG